MPSAAAFALTTLDEIDRLDLTVDGADEIDPALNLIKGGGGALAARKDRRRRLGSHDRDRRRFQMGRDARPLSAAHRGHSVRAGRDAARHRRGICRKRRFRPNGGAKGPGTATFLSPMAATGSSMPISGRITDAPRLAGSLKPPYRVLSSTGCSSALPAWRCWRALREFALLNGANAAIEENWNEGSFKNFVGREPWPCRGVGAVGAFRPRRSSTGRPAARAAQAGFAGGDRSGQGNPGHEECRRDICQCGSQHRSANQGCILLQNNLNYQKDLNEVAVDRRPEDGRPREGNRRADGEDLRQRVHRAGTEGPRHILQVAARPEAARATSPRPFRRAWTI